MKTTTSTATRRTNEVLAVAEFDERLPTYFMLRTLLAFLFTLFLAPLIPLWLALGMRFHRKEYEALSAVLTRRSLKIERGVIGKLQKSVPLDKITDLALMEGPLLRRFGLCSLRVETAGGGQGTTTGHVALIGVKDAVAFRDQVLAQRDAVVFGEEESAAKPVAPAPSPSTAVASEESTEVLIEIRDSLRRMEAMMKDRQNEGS